MAMTRWFIDTRPLWLHEDQVLAIVETNLIKAALVAPFSCGGGATANTIEASIR